MFRIFIVLVTLFVNQRAMAQESPKWLYKGAGMPNDTSTVAVVVAIDRYYNAIELDDARTNVKERGLAVAQELAQWEDVTHIALLSASSARKAEITSIVGGLPKVQRIIFVWIGLGIGNDFGQPRLLPSDVRTDDLEGTSLTPSEVKELLTSHAKDVDIIIDASAKGAVASLALVGPDATAFESESCGSCWVLSASKGRAVNESDGFVSDVIAFLAERRRLSQVPVGYGEIASTLATSWTPDLSYQGVLPTDTFLTRPAPPLVVSVNEPVAVGTPLPETPVVKKPLKANTKIAIVLGVGGLAAGAISIAEAVETARIHDTMDTNADKIANYGGHSSWQENNAALEKAEGERALAGWLSVGAGLAAAGLTTAAIVVEF